MNSKSFIPLLLCLGSMMLPAEESVHLIIHQTDNTTKQVALQQSPRLEFDQYNLVLTMQGDTLLAVPYENVDRLTFQQAVESAVENIENSPCRIMLQQHTLWVHADQTICGMQIWNIQGQLVYALPYGNHGTELTIPAHWNVGVYIVGIETPTDMFSYKIIIP